MGEDGREAKKLKELQKSCRRDVENREDSGVRKIKVDQKVLVQ